MSFIHGAVSWSDDVCAVRQHVESMVAAVGAYPWLNQEITQVSTGHTSCVLAVQGSTPRDLPVVTGQGIGAGAPVSVAGDLQLHDREGLADQLGLGAAENAVRDAELVLRAYQRWGVACPEHLLGVGTFALWEEAEQRLLCWRDVAGARPLYYHLAPGRHLIFSSDLMSIAAHPHIPTTLDLEYTRAVLETGTEFQHPSRTMCAGIHKLPAAHWLTVDPTGLRVQAYWSPWEVSERRYRRESEYVDELRDLLHRAVACRLPGSTEASDVGAHLSGGLDSSSVAVVAGREMHATGRQLSGYSWAPPWELVPCIDEDERPLAEAAARSGNVRLHYTRLSGDDVIDVARRDRALQPTTTLTVENAATVDASKAGVRTMLSGWGGDELVVFNGRGYFADLARRGRWLTVQRELRRRSKIHSGSVYRTWRGRVVLPLLPDRVLRTIWPQDRPGLPSELRPEFARCLTEVEPLTESNLRERPGVRRMQVELLTNGHVQYRMESWAAHGAERGITYAFPLLDQRIIEFALSIPDHLYFKDGWKRWLYRTAMAGILPDEVRWYPHKQDNAMEVQLREVGRSATGAYHDQLRNRRDNPFVDTDRIIAAHDRPAAHITSRDATARPKSPAGSAAWLAFTRLSAP